jgi:DEAD/DEAH box helicase domain-containing protein
MTDMHMSRYRCPKCSSLNSVDVNNTFDGRLLFQCLKCNICAIVSLTNSFDEAYLEFLAMYDNGYLAEIEDLKTLMEQERILRPASEIKSLISKNNAVKNEFLKTILYSQYDYIVDYRLIEELEAEMGDQLEQLPIDDAITAALEEKKIERLYKFQEEAIRKILLGIDTVIIAPTASGKTEAFCIPILQKISEEVSYFGSLQDSVKGKISAIFVYPTKALSRDQLPKIKQLAERLGIRVNVFDGDSSKNEKDFILNFPPDIVITNFDILHYHLMHRTLFSRSIRSAKFLVVDEVHVYTGVFGANIHHLINRLERLSNKKKLQVVASSATLPNARNFCQTLFGRKMEIVQGMGRKGKINFVILFPSLRSNRSLMLYLLKQTTKRNIKTIAFSNSHLGAELLAFYASRQQISIRVHRAGLLTAVRKAVEQSFKHGELMAISATPTLELGIDIGDVDAIISNIVPINRLMQRFGRAARRGQQGYAFLTLGNDPISQYYRFHPDDYMADQEQAYTDPSNPIVEEYQVLAMACDRPLSTVESYPVWNTVQKLVSKRLLKVVNKTFVPDFKKASELLRDYSIRGIGSTVDILFNEKIVGERSLPQALEELHENAVYFLSGRRYQVKKLHFEKKGQPYAEIMYIPKDYPYYTKAIIDEWPSILEIYERKKVFGIEVTYCSLKIQKRVVGYSNIEIGQEVAQGKKVMLESPIEFEFVTKGFVFRAPRPLDSIHAVDDKQFVEIGSYHASEHVIIEGSAMITGGASQDLGGISVGSSGLIFIYDGSIGGNGASRVLYDKFDRALGRALRILTECPCKSESGCPRCTYSYRCGNNNEYLHKFAANEVLNRISEGEYTEIGEKIQVDRSLV